MQPNFFILTNNPLVRETYKDSYSVEYKAGNFLNVLIAARDYIYAGHSLLTHPLAGSVKPNETPYKTVAIATEKTKLDFSAVEIISGSIQTCEKFLANANAVNTREYTEEILADFQQIDCSLISCAIEIMGT